MTPKHDITRQTIRYFWQHARHYPRYIVGIGLAVPLTVLINQVIPPLILAHVLNRLSTHDFEPNRVWASFGPELIAYGLLQLIGRSVMWRIVDWFVWRLEGNVERDIAEEVFSHLTAQSAGFHADHFGGSLVSQSNKLMGAYIRTADTTIFQVIPLLWGLLFSIAILARLAPLYAAMLAVFAIIYMTSAFYVTRKARKLGAQHAKIESRQTGYLSDAITNIMTIKSFAGRRYEQQRFARATGETRQSLLRFGRTHQRQQVYFGSLLGSISALALVMAVVGVVIFDADIATVFLIFSYTSTIAQDLFQFSNSALRSYNRAFGDARDMIDILQQPAEITDPATPEPVRIQHGTISFDNVHFRHKGAAKPIFQNLTLHVKPGEKVGLVGHSGSGKTTLTRILLRFSDIQKGTIRIDGQDITAITQDDLRRHIAYVPQEPLLFHRSIAENIRYGNADADMDTVMAVAKMASADEFISALPDGYDTMVGERGIKLSGGQRQRIAIARAMLKNAPILVLDEATSALDSQSEIFIQQALWKLMENRTALVIAHRLSTIQKMDRIIVMNNGRIVEEGSHKELLLAGGTYAKLWAHQSGGFIES